MKVRRIHRENREASITPALVRRLIIVAAQKGFFEAQLNIRKELRGELVRRKVQVSPGEQAQCGKLHSVVNHTDAMITVDLREPA